MNDVIPVHVFHFDNDEHPSREKCAENKKRKENCLEVENSLRNVNFHFLELWPLAYGTLSFFLAHSDLCTANKRTLILFLWNKWQGASRDKFFCANMNPNDKKQ